MMLKNDVARFWCEFRIEPNEQGKPTPDWGGRLDRDVMQQPLESVMKEELLKCPNCGSAEVTVSHMQRFMANTGEHYCHAVKTHDANSEATCLDCQWIGRRDQLVHNN